MCDPVSASLIIGGLATSAWATHNQTKAANRNMQAVQTAKEGKYQEGMNRQRQYADEAAAAFRPMVEGQGAGGFADKMAADTANRMRAFSSGKVPVVGDYSFSGSTPGNVAKAMEKAFSESDNKANRDNKNLAVLGAYNGANFGADMDRNKYARAFGNIADTAGRDSNLIGLDMQQAATRAFKGPNSAVGLMKQLGGIASMGGAALAGAGGVRTTEAARPTSQAFGSYGPQPGVTSYGGYTPRY